MLRRPIFAVRRTELLQARRNVVEGGRDLAAESGHRADGGDCDESCDQAIFDSRRALGILKNLTKKLHG